MSNWLHDAHILRTCTHFDKRTSMKITLYNSLYCVCLSIHKGVQKNISVYIQTLQNNCKNERGEK